LVEQDNHTPVQGGDEGNSSSGAFKPSDTQQSYVSAAPRTTTVPQSDYNVSLISMKKRRKPELTEDVRLGSLVIPLTNLPLDRATNGNEAARVEQWYQVESLDDTLTNTQQSSGRRKKPRVLLEISFSSPEILDDSEDEMEDEHPEDLNASEGSFNAPKTLAMIHGSFARRATIDAKSLLEQDKPKEVRKVEDPVLEPGVIDFISVVGARDIGGQKNDDGSKGWVNSTPERCILEQFPPNDEFHQKTGRSATLAQMIEWFCFPEGCRLWRGTGPPTHSDLNLKRFSASSPPNVASSIAAFDACLNCTTSFSWFVIASNSDKYGSSLVKTYGAVIRFYAPAPTGIDPTQDDFAQTLMDATTGTRTQSGASTKRLWVPVGICLTTNLPIIGIMEAMLLRLCEELMNKAGGSHIEPPKLEEIHASLAKLIINFQKPIPGAVNCSLPFLSGDRFLLTLPPPTGLPALPHGHAVLSVCRLLGAEGLNFLLAAILTESKILIHCDDIADVAMVAEVVTALCYPFTWSLPYIPILPVGMLEFVEAPLSYILGVPTCSLKLMDRQALDDVVVVDLDNGFSSADYFEGKRAGSGSRSLTPLPASVATNISKAVYRLLRAEEKEEEEFGGVNYDSQRSLPRLETESLAEREFRVAVAIQISGLLRGYQECTGPVFNRDKFLKIAPALFEDRRDAMGVGSALGSRGSSSSNQQKILAPRSKRFLSALVNTQNFYQLLESLEGDCAAFFHEIMDSFEDSDNKPTRGTMDNGMEKKDKTLTQLCKALQKVEDKIPTYRVDKGSGLDDDDDGFVYEDSDDGFQDFSVIQDEPDFSSPDDGNITSFTEHMLQKLGMKNFSAEGPGDTGEGQEAKMKAASHNFLAEMEKNPWKYKKVFDIPLDNAGGGEPIVKISEKVKLRDAIGERRYRAWKIAQDQKLAGGDDDFRKVISEDFNASKQGASLDLTSLITLFTNDLTDSSSLASLSLNSQRTSNLSPEQQRVVDAKNRDIIRRCLDKAQGGNNHYGRLEDDEETLNPFVENGRDLIAEAEKALQHPSAQRFLLSILGQRSRLEIQRGRQMRRQLAVSSVSKLEPIAFDCLIRLSCAMLDACMEYKEFEPAYRLLTYTSGFITVIEENEEDERDHHAFAKQVISMTSRIGLHPIFADLGVWEKVMSIHLQDRLSEKKAESNSNYDQPNGDDTDEDEEGTQEYEAAVATLYEMLGYGIPGEELSRFATRASEENGWFCDERGKQLLMLARRISIRREQTDDGAATGSTGDIDMIRKGQDGGHTRNTTADGSLDVENENHSWIEIGWCHPAAPTSRNAIRSDGADIDVSASSESDYMKRSPVTALASFGSSVVVTGGLDGSVFLAHSIAEEADEDNFEPAVRGIHLDWGSASRASAGSSSDGEYGVGAVSCLAAAYGTGHNGAVKPSAKDTGGGVTDEEFVASMEGSRVVAGTTAGDLRVWSVKDVYSAVALMKKGDEAEPSSLGGGNAMTRLKFSLRGRALSGHRGGVTCIDVPSHVYRPDSLVTGGADGLIKLWSLRAPTGGRRAGTAGASETDNTTQQRGRGGDALSILTGHTGRILCVKTAWHGDRLLSGGADRTLRIWDLTSSSGKCLHTLSGHFGWVTKVQYWGPNTIVSASTDRSISLWDARVRSSPLFVLRHHHSPISDILVGSRTDPLMVSAAADGTVATWDFRTLSGSTSSENTTRTKDTERHCKVVRYPAATMRHGLDGKRRMPAGSVLLARGVTDSMNSVLSVGTDAISREWEIATGQLMEASSTGHCDVVSSFSSFGHSEGLSPEMGFSSDNVGTITCSWDGTIRMRKLIREY
jgi:WD40 repeat protein